MKTYTKQPKLSTFLSENSNVTAKDYNSLFVGDYKNHHRKIKSMFKTAKESKQVDLSLANRICPPIKHN